MKLAVAHLIMIVVAIALFEIGQRTTGLTFSRAGLVALLISCLLLLADMTLSVIESFRDSQGTVADLS
ncbi:hypothetical protein YA0089_27915 [Pseudomonas viridiflava]|uniref:hypothetical protein n=1 Tax=Pseudomonas viridiflava TaxID=33069 RepID=UPI0018E6625A|nr:hypothetical protein [Pseudomonas viridiflava]MBI6727448.1 hypothetical protein [Pseudomonas viridiflava]